MLLKFADLLEKNIEQLASLESLDNGKPFTNSYGEVLFSIDIARYYAGFTDKIHGKTIPISGPYLCYTREEPVGVCG